MESGIGERFARALGAKDAETLKTLLAPNVEFRALTPGQFWESSNADDVVDSTFFTEWFAPHDKILGVLSVQGSEVGNRQHVAYRFALECPDGPYQVEQQAYYDVEGDRITWLRILCSGNQPIEMP